MEGLSPALQCLFDAGRCAHRPTLADRERLLKAIQARLGLAVGMTGEASVVTVLEDFSGTRALRTVAKTTLGIALIVAGLALLHWLAQVTLKHGNAAWDTSAASADLSSVVSPATAPSQQHDPTQRQGTIHSTVDQTSPAATTMASRISVRTHPVYSSKSIDGSWNPLGTIKVNANGFRSANTSSHTTFGPNPDGSILATPRGGRIMVSTCGLTGPFVVRTKPWWF